MHAVQVLLIHQRTLVRDSLAQVCSAQGDLNVAGLCGSADEALQILKTTPVDVIIADAAILKPDEGAFIAALPPAGLLVIADPDEAISALSALQAGAAGIFFTDYPATALPGAIRLLASGSGWLDQRLLRLLAQRSTARPDPHFRVPIAASENQILNGVCGGLTNRAIAASMSVSEGTVKAVLQKMYRRLGVKSRSQLVRAIVGSRRQ